MKTSKTLMIVSILAGLLAAIQSGVGLFWQGGGSPFSFTTLHGDVVQIAGQGTYAFDTYFKAPIFRGTDAVTLFFCLPLLVIALLLYRGGSLRGQLMLTGVLAYLLYNSGSVALGTAYNNLFLVYVGYFSTSLFAFIMAFTSIDRNAFASRISNQVPRRGIAALMFVSSAGLLCAWVPDVLGALLKGAIPAIASYTTEVTYAIDLGIIVPVCFMAGLLILRRAPLGYLLSSTLLILLVIIGVMVSTQTIFQSLAGITLGIGEFIGKAGSFILLSLVAIGLLVRFFRNIEEPAAFPKPLAQTAEA